MKEITNKKEASKFLGIKEDEILNFYLYNKYFWEYKDKNCYCHLFQKIGKKWIELTKNIKAKFVFSYENGDWEYEDDEGYFHLFRCKKNKWTELTKNVKAIDCYSYCNRHWGYKNENNHSYRFNKFNLLIRINHGNGKKWKRSIQIFKYFRK